jgi:hypothetical protein
MLIWFAKDITLLLSKPANVQVCIRMGIAPRTFLRKCILLSGSHVPTSNWGIIPAVSQALPPFQTKLAESLHICRFDASQLPVWLPAGLHSDELPPHLCPECGGCQPASRIRASGRSMPCKLQGSPTDRNRKCAPAIAAEFAAFATACHHFRICLHQRPCLRHHLASACHRQSRRRLCRHLRCTALSPEAARTRERACRRQAAAAARAAAG